MSAAPTDAPRTALIVEYLEKRGIPYEYVCYGGMLNSDMYRIHATFLDGGLDAQTGNYMFEARYAIVTGPRAVLWLAFGLGLRVHPSLLTRMGMQGVSFAELDAEVQRASAQPTSR